MCIVANQLIEMAKASNEAIIEEIVAAIYDHQLEINHDNIVCGESERNRNINIENDYDYNQ